jgi:hypothetical protein
LLSSIHFGHIHHVGDLLLKIPDELGVALQELARCVNPKRASRGEREEGETSNKAVIGRKRKEE